MVWFFFFWTTGGLAGHLAGAAQCVLPGWGGGGKVEHHNTAQASLIPLQMTLVPASAGIEGGRGRKSIEFVVQSSFICALINRTGHSCHIHNLINLPYQKIMAALESRSIAS